LKQLLKNLELPDRFWGLRPETIYVYLSDLLRGTNYLQNFIKLETLETNTPSSEDYKRAIAMFSDYLGVSLNNRIEPLGKVLLLSEEPLEFIKALLFSKDNLLRNFITAATQMKTDKMNISELEVYFPGESDFYGRLLQSFEFISILKNRITLAKDNLEKTSSIMKFSVQTANWLCAKSIFHTLMPFYDDELSDKLAVGLLSELCVPFNKVNDNLSIVDAVKHLGNNVEGTVATLMAKSDALLHVLVKTQQEFDEENAILMTQLVSDKQFASQPQIIADLTGFKSRKGNNNSECLDSIINRILYLQNFVTQINLKYIIAGTNLSLDDLGRLLIEVFGPDVQIDAYSIKLVKKYNWKIGTKNHLNNYLKFIFESYAKNDRCIKQLKDVIAYLKMNAGDYSAKIESTVNRLFYNRLNTISANLFSPFYFVYTLPLPDSLGKEVIDSFKGHSDALEREVFKLSVEWPEKKTNTSQTYSDMTARFFAKGIERELATKEIRIMTPYTDYELEKYVSMLRALIIRGYNVRIICRLHANQKRWKVLQDSLLRGLGEKGTSVNIRTYTRFKRFRSAQELGNISADQRQEFGVHAKLFIIGDEENGAALLGSANLLDNSFNWNPECGVYTEQGNFIKAGKAFFDFVWKLAEKDQLDLSKLQRIPKGPFFPNCYQ
jgi:hypothetical protein